MRTHTRKWKEESLAEIRKLITKYPTIAVADLSMFPASLFQAIRKKISAKGTIRVTKVRVLRMALKEAKGKEVLADYSVKSCAVIFTTMNPFELFAFLKKNKGSISAKEGDLAPEDILVPAGDTGLPPGPALSDLKAAGLKVSVQGSTIAVMEDKIVTKKGEPVSKPVAGTLSKLDIKPIKVGLRLIASLENGQIFEAKVLDIDTDKVFLEFVDAHRKAFNLAYNAQYFTKEVTELLLQKAFREAKEVAIEGAVFEPDVMPDIIAKAVRQAKALEAAMPEAPAAAAPATKEVAEEKKE
jgi:large subunit ribosomal protein L10